MSKRRQTVNTCEIFNTLRPEELGYVKFPVQFNRLREQNSPENLSSDFHQTWHVWSHPYIIIYSERIDDKYCTPNRQYKRDG